MPPCWLKVRTSFAILTYFYFYFHTLPVTLLFSSPPQNQFIDYSNFSYHLNGICGEEYPTNFALEFQEILGWVDHWETIDLLKNLSFVLPFKNE
jgi:hypothetical protein